MLKIILESLGYSVDFRLFEMSSVSEQIHFSEFILKGETERLNPQKLYFPLCHPSWIRRLNFRLIEVTKMLLVVGQVAMVGHVILQQSKNY